MKDWKPRFWAKVLTAYGMAPYHPGKWRAMERLQGRAAEEWKTTRVVRRRGIWYQLNLNDYLPRWVFLNCFEVWETHLLQRIVHNGWTAIDIGANIGYYTSLLARMVGPNGRVYSFEPSGVCYDNLGCNVGLNSFVNVTSFRLAVGDDCREVAMKCTDVHHPSKAYVSMAGESPTELVKMITLDKFAEEQRLDRLDFVKIDIEGFEGAFLRGAGGTLARFQPIVMIELNPTALARYGSNAEHIIDQLRNLGYRLFRVTWHGLVPLRGVPGPGDYWNVFAFAR